MQGKILSIVAGDAPQGQLRDEEEGFYLRFPSSRRGLRSFTPSLSHTHRKWGSIGNRGTTADRGRQGGVAIRDTKGSPRGYEYEYGPSCAWVNLG